MKKVISIVLAGFALLSCGQETIPVYKDATKDIEKRVEDLLSRMTLEEKILQQNQYRLGRNENINNIGEAVSVVPPEAGSVIYTSDDAVLRNAMQRRAMEETRLGIPMIYGFDVIHGFRTMYPIPLGQAASWNPSLAAKACEMAASEARASGVDWTFSPMVDVAHDPRWGRVMEGYGEDPYLASMFSDASVRGYQGDDLTSGNTVAACMKHYVGYGASEAGRDYVPTDITLQSLWDTYLPPFEAGIKAGAQTVMSAFNTLSAIPASANHYTLTEVLKEKWGHDGFVVSDWKAVEQLVYQGYAADGKEATMLAINSGLEMDMIDDLYRQHLPELVKEGKVSMKQIDESVRRILRVKFRLGLFENPYTEEKPESERVLLPEYREVALEMARESMVLLKNEDQALPLSGDIKVALIGPAADDARGMVGNWSGRGRAEDMQTYKTGLEKALGSKNVCYAYGCDYEGADRSGFQAAVSAVRRSDVVVLCLGEHYSWSGENCSRSEIELPAVQKALLKTVSAAAHTAGKKVVLVLTNGRPLALTEEEPLVDAILEAWIPGTAAGDALADLLLGHESPSGRLTLTFPRSVGQVPVYYNHRNRARRGVQGIYMDIPSTPLYDFGYGLSYTEFDYGEMSLSAVTKSSDEVKLGASSAIDAIRDYGKVSLEGEYDGVYAESHPSECASVRLSDVEKLVAKIKVSNVGKMDAKEVVQWYISDLACSITRPVKELKHFEKRLVNAGETVEFVFEIDPLEDLGFVDAKGNRFVEPGKFILSCGGRKIQFTLD